MLQVFQLRVARSALGLGVRDIGAYINISRSAVSKIERGSITNILKVKEEQNSILIKIFNDKGVFFPRKNCVQYGLKEKEYNVFLTRFQLRAGRAALGLSQRQMSEKLNIEKNILNYLENIPNSSLICNTQKIQDTCSEVFKEFFDKNNIFFPTENSIEISG